MCDWWEQMANAEIDTDYAKVKKGEEHGERENEKTIAFKVIRRKEQS